MNQFEVSDEALRNVIRERLLSLNEVDWHNFDIQVDHGVVKLLGEVPGRHAKRLAEACLQDVEGIRNIENRLKVQRVTRYSDNSTHGF